MLKLSYYRNQLGLSQIQLAKKLNMSQQTISAYENGTRQPDLDTLRKFADFFGVTTDELLGVSEPQPLVAFDGGLDGLTDEQKKIIMDLVENMKNSNK